MTDEDRLDQAYAHCDALTRAHDRDRWLAALFAPAEARRHLHALYAFSYEVGRLRDFVREPMAGEIRLQWWREAIEGERRTEAQASPVAAALIDTIARFRLPIQAFDSMLAARVFDLYDDPMPDVAAFEAYCGETSSLLFRLASLILAGRDNGGADAAGHAGVACATAGLLRALPIASMRGQVYLPMDILSENGVSREDIVGRREGPKLRAALRAMRDFARRHLEKASSATKPEGAAAAYLPLALVALYLKRMERADYRPFDTVVEVPQWRRQWAMWRAARRVETGAVKAAKGAHEDE
ncbi:MAG TPA: phytoene/squalene synthase family protein [Roseiarcus sp.]|nr:phytoene/squalene synthase family protein [Roseiarcus sp.]